MNWTSKVLKKQEMSLVDTILVMAGETSQKRLKWITCLAISFPYHHPASFWQPDQFVQAFLLPDASNISYLNARRLAYIKVTI